MMGFVLLILWIGGDPRYLGQYATRDQCWSIVHQLTEHGVDENRKFKFSCYDTAGGKK